jgi:hypothetical protein
MLVTSEEVKMHRYGDNITHKDENEDKLWYERERQQAVFFGGCGAMYGAFPGAATGSKKAAQTGLLAFFRSLYKKTSRMEN